MRDSAEPNNKFLRVPVSDSFVSYSRQIAKNKSASGKVYVADVNTKAGSAKNGLDYNCKNK